MPLFSRPQRSAPGSDLLTHAAQGDAIPYLATVIGFLEDSVRASCDTPDAARAADYAARVRAELRGLQREYRLVPDASGRSYGARKMVRFR